MDQPIVPIITVEFNTEQLASILADLDRELTWVAGSYQQRAELLIEHLRTHCST
jgi:hypothetical protein